MKYGGNLQQGPALNRTVNTKFTIGISISVIFITNLKTLVFRRADKQGNANVQHCQNMRQYVELTTTRSGHLIEDVNFTVALLIFVNTKFDSLQNRMGRLLVLFLDKSKRIGSQ